MTQEQYITHLKKGIEKYGLRGYADVLGVDKRRLHEEINNPQRKYGKHDSNVITKALGLKRVQTVHYERVRISPDPTVPGKSKTGAN